MLRIMVIAAELNDLLLLMGSLFLFLIFCYIICCNFSLAWDSWYKRNVRLLWRVLLWRRKERIHIKPRRRMMWVSGTKHWIIKLRILRNHSLLKASEWGSRKIHWMGHPIMVASRSLRINRRWHPWMIH